MKNFAIQLEKFGSIENLSLQEVPVPIPEDDEVLVKISRYSQTSIYSWTRGIWNNSRSRQQC